MRPEERRARDEADKVWRLLIRARAGYRCESPHCPNRGRPGAGMVQLEAAHIVPRGHSRTRHDLANGRALCGEPCHRGPEGVDGGGWDWAELIGEAEYQRLRSLGIDPLWKRPPTWFRDQLAQLTGVT